MRDEANQRDRKSPTMILTIHEKKGHDREDNRGDARRDGFPAVLTLPRSGKVRYERGIGEAIGDIIGQC